MITKCQTDDCRMDGEVINDCVLMWNEMVART